MRRTFIFILTLMMCAQIAAAEGPSDQTFRDLEAQILHATLTKDAAQIDKLLASDYVSVGLSGQVRSKAAIVESYSSKGFAISSATEDKVTIRRYEGMAIVIGLLTLSGTSNGLDISGTYAFTRVYKRGGNTWLAISYQATPVK
jgi:hypothetical protein